MPDPAADQAALNAQLNITNQLNQLIQQSIEEQRDLMREINNELKGGINFSKESRKLYNTIEDISQKLVDDAEELVELSEKQLEKERTRAKKTLDRLQYVGRELKANEEQLRAKKTLNVQEEALLAAAKLNFIEEEKTLQLINDRIDRQKVLNKSVGLTGALLKGAAGMAEKLGFSGTVVEHSLTDAKKAAYETAKALEKSGANMGSLATKTKTMVSGFKSLGGSLLKSFSDPLVLLTAQIALLKKFFELYGAVNQRIVDQQKQLGISYEASNKLYESAHQYAASQRNAFVTEARILEGRHKLNEALGTSIAFTDKEAITAEKLSHYYGISEEQNANLAVLARQTNQTNDDILNTVIKTANEQKRQFGGSMSYQKTVQKISGISGEILTKFKGNVTELTKAVQQADRLGLTLEQVDKIAESLLNFESSIENELKAELLTGKAINVEKARAAALSGNQAVLMNEIASQVGNIHQFEKMNVIQRKAYAEAFGLSADEMGNMLRKKDLEAKLGMDISKSATEALKVAKEKNINVEESLRKELEAKSLAELQKYTFEKILSIITRLTAGPMKTLYGFLEKGLKFVEKIFGYFGQMTGGPLGDALGAAILGAPLLIGAVRLLVGGIRGMFMGPRGTDLNPMIVRMQGAIGGGVGMGSGGSFVPGLGYVSKQSTFRLAGTYQGTAQERLAQARKTQANMGMRNMGIGMGLGIGGMALSSISSGMEEGGAKDTVGVLGSTATYAGVGMMFGPIGGAIGGLVGLGMGLFNLSKENEERRKAEMAKKAEDDKKYQDMVEALSVRPLQLNVGNESLATFSTRQSLTNASSDFA
jgi:hypothetical protein